MQASEGQTKKRMEQWGIKSQLKDVCVEPTTVLMLPIWQIGSVNLSSQATTRTGDPAQTTVHSRQPNRQIRRVMIRPCPTAQPPAANYEPSDCVPTKKAGLNFGFTCSRKKLQWETEWHNTEKGPVSTTNLIFVFRRVFPQRRPWFDWRGCQFSPKLPGFLGHQLVFK